MIDALFRRMRPWNRLLVAHPWWVLVVASGVSVTALLTALRLEIDTDLARLLPRDYPSVEALEQLRETVGGESAASVIIESPSFEANRDFAETLIPEAMSLRRGGEREAYFVRVEYRKEIDFLTQNALYFGTEEELRELELYLKQQWARTQRIGLRMPARRPNSPDLKLIDTYREAVPTEYPISEDSTTMVVKFYPSGAQTQLDYVEALYKDLDALVDTLNPETFHPGMNVYVGGRLERQLIEVRAIRQDLIGSVGGGVGTVLLVVMLYFWYKSVQARSGARSSRRLIWSELKRTPIAALLVAIPMAMSLTWTFGLVELAFGALNIMTSMLVLVLFGLGVDYGIHYYARYTEERGEGLGTEEANERTFQSSGPAILVSAMTTAASLFILVAADFRGFSQFGVVAGTGIVFAVIATLVVMPALLVVCERARLLDLRAEQAQTAEDTVEDEGRSERLRGWRTMCVVSIIATIMALLVAPGVRLEYRYGELEPDFTEYNSLREKESRVYATTKRNPAYIVVEDGEDVRAVVDTLRARMEADTTILSVESLQERYPVTEEEQERKLAQLEVIRTWLEKPELRILGAGEVEMLRKAAQTTEPIPIEEVPEFLKAQFTSKSGELGNFVIVYPAVGLSDARNSMRFAEAIGTVETPGGRIYHAASSSIIAAELMRLLIEESPWMIGLTSVVLLLLLALMFRKTSWTLLAVMPLVVGVAWMMGLMALLDIRLNFYNLVVLPAVLGIGVDGGVHIVHRYREVGQCCVGHVLRSTGEHVAVGSITTLIAFAWWLLSFHPGLKSIGQLAVVGISTVLVAALLTLPATLELLEATGWSRGGKPQASDGVPDAGPALDTGE